MATCIQWTILEDLWCVFVRLSMIVVPDRNQLKWYGANKINLWATHASQWRGSWGSSPFNPGSLLHFSPLLFYFNTAFPYEGVSPYRYNITVLLLILLFSNARLSMWPGDHVLIHWDQLIKHLLFHWSFISCWWTCCAVVTNWSSSASISSSRTPALSKSQGCFTGIITPVKKFIDRQTDRSLDLMQEKEMKSFRWNVWMIFFSRSCSQWENKWEPEMGQSVQAKCRLPKLLIFMY